MLTWSWFSRSVCYPRSTLFPPQLFSVRKEVNLLVRLQIIFSVAKLPLYIQYMWNEHGIDKKAAKVKCFSGIRNWIHHIGAAIDSPMCDRIDFIPTTGTTAEKNMHSYYFYLNRSLFLLRKSQYCKTWTLKASTQQPQCQEGQVLGMPSFCIPGCCIADPAAFSILENVWGPSECCTDFQH